MIALLYDVHGNLPALEAVLDDAGTPRDGWIIGGDVALFGPWPVETVGRLRELDAARWLRGNGERWVATPSDAPDDEVVQAAIDAARKALGRDAEDLGKLPESVPLDDDTRCWHGSPVSDVRSFLPEPADDEEELLEGIAAPRVVFGHTHLPFARVSDVRGIELVNPGSVGMPFDGDTRAAYALCHEDRRIEHRRVEYDVAASVARVRGFGARWSAVVAARIEQARMDV
jgi:diadenosine tetraphosphatase ApaH/serine/threonine PP2A family protein phosphatase